MTDKFNLQAAIKQAMQTEKDARDYYKYGAEKMTDPKAKKSFEILAAEEKQHAHMFFNIYRGDEVPSFDEFMAAAPDTTSSWWKALHGSMMGDFDERKAIELAIELEATLEEDLRAMAAKIDDVAVKDIYLANARSTHHHYELCMEERNALFGASN